MSIFRSSAADVWNPWGWVDFDGVQVTPLPLVDRCGLFARADYTTALAIAAEHGASLMSTDIADAIHAKGYRLRPVILPPTSEMASEAWCLRHDQGVWQQLTEWDGRPVSNAGKDWIRSAPPGRSANYGWYDPKAPNGRMWQSLGTRHDRSHVDYSQLLRLVREPKAPTGGHDLPPRPLGERALDVALEEERRGVREFLGPASNPRVSEYHACTVRNGRPTGLRDDALAWCASAASWCLQQALLPDETKPHDFRAAVRELVEDAKERGSWRERDWRPYPGDLAIFSRAGGDPTKGGTGHVSRVIRVDGETIRLLGANENDGWRFSECQRSEKTLRGFIRYPR